MKSRSRVPYLFDQQDFDLVELVNEVTRKRKEKRPDRVRKLFNPYLHPRGIKELAATRQQRIAFAVVRLLRSLDSEAAQDRLLALKALHDELVEGGQHEMLLNTGRVLIEIMKDLVRERGDSWRQVELAHQFFSAASGRPSVVRRNLREYHLLEMSEKWNQVAFDHHVHDANTKGRKSPTHLIVDAWIKGIRDMTVIYYHFLTAEAVSELVEAAQAMDVTVRPAVEVSARFRGKYVQFIWVPRGLHTTREYLEFIERPAVKAFFDEGKEIERWHTRHVLGLLDSFNRNHLATFNATWQLHLEPLRHEEFLLHVGVGQPSMTHLADYIHHLAMEEAEPELASTRERWPELSAAERKQSQERVRKLDGLLPEQIARTYLWASANPDLPDISIPRDGDGVPEMLQRSPAELLKKLKELRSGCHVTLNPSNLSPADVLEILYEGAGTITHLEIFNLKDHRRHRNPQIGQIAEIRRVLNSGNPIAAKKMFLDIIRGVEESDEPEKWKKHRIDKLQVILGDLQRLLSFYAKDALGCRMGTDSIGRAREWSGMGLAVLETLPRATVSKVLRNLDTREVVPIRVETVLSTTWMPLQSHVWVIDAMYRLSRRIPGIREFGYRRKDSYLVVPEATQMREDGNLLTLGGTPEKPGNGLSLEARQDSESPRLRWRSLNTRTKNFLKILLGLVPAVLTFALTKDWWVLAWGGAFIWFAITGLRNIVQAIAGGAGVIRSQLLRWKDLVSWGRVADSLLYTGFSVPLLDWLVKSLMLDRGLGINTQTSPLALYAVMGLANGIYLFSHNTFRGLPRGAALGNFFRSVLSIPIAFGFNWILLKLMLLGGMEWIAATAMLQSWAAVIGKLASDTVAGFIEGTADRNVALRLRHKDYSSKIARLLEVHGRLEAMFPKVDVAACLASPKEFFRTLGLEALELEAQQIINSLDLMYFWMLQPRARVVFKDKLAAASPEERQIILRTQRLLERKRPVSELFLQDLVGKNFSPPLAFYLDRSASYLADMRQLADQFGVDWRVGGGDGTGKKAMKRAAARPSGDDVEPGTGGGSDGGSAPSSDPEPGADDDGPSASASA